MDSGRGSKFLSWWQRIDPAAWWLLLTEGYGAARCLDSSVERRPRPWRVRVVETRVVVSAKATASTPKTAAGRRAIPLDDRLVSELKSHWARQAAERLAAGEAWEDSDYLFVDEVGHPTAGDDQSPIHEAVDGRRSPYHPVHDTGTQWLH